MLVIKQRRLIGIGIIVIGLIFFGMPAVYAQDDFTEDVLPVPEWATDDYTDDYNDDEDLEALGDYSEDLVYTPVKPCRIVDTRYGGGGFVSAGVTRNWQVQGNLAHQGGSTCTSPVGHPSAAHIQLIAVDPNGKGNVLVYPYGSSAGAGVAVNFNKIGTNLANAGTTPVNRTGTYDISVKSSFSGCHVLIMVLGYYTRPEATAVESVIKTTTINIVPSGNGEGVASCPSGYRITGGGCHWNHFHTSCQTMSSRPWSNGWQCGGRNNWDTVQEFHIHAVCTRTRGR